MQLFSIPISSLCYLLMGGAALCALILILFYCRRVDSVRRRRKACSNMGIPEELPNASVVVYCDGTTYGLQTLLETVLSQEYGADYEVIVINDGSTEDVKDVYNRLIAQYSHLRMTFIPGDAHNISRRKLAMTLGIKGARYPYVVVIDSSSQVLSSHWLASMTRHFNDGNEVVLGYAVYDKEEDTGRGSKLRGFDTAADAVTYLSAAIGHRPYRGHGGNFAFAKHLFSYADGFSRSLNLHNGDDDIFISQIANPRNTAVELSPQSRVILDSENPKALHDRWKWSHVFTARYVRKTPRRLMGLYSWLFWLGTACAVGASIAGWPSLYPAIAMLALGAMLWIIVNYSWSKALSTLGAKRQWLSIPWFVMTRPFYNLYFRFVARRNRGKNYIWAIPR